MSIDTNIFKVSKHYDSSLLNYIKENKIDLGENNRFVNFSFLFIRFFQINNWEKFQKLIFQKYHKESNLQPETTLDVKDLCSPST